MSDKPYCDLTVVIPTYSRIAELKELIDDLQIAQQRISFPVKILNDRGPEEAFIEITAYAEARLRDLDIILNETNLGIDRNIHKSLASADTEFVLAIGDDDRINVDSFIALLTSLPSVEEDLVIVEYSYVYGDLSMQKPKVIDPEPRMDLTTLAGKKAFLFERGTKLGFLGSVMFRTKAYAKFRDDAFLGTWFGHVGAALSLLFADDTKTSYRPDSVVLNRAGDIRVTSWSSQMFDVIHGWWRMVEQFCKMTPHCTFEEYRANKADVTFQYDKPAWMLSRRAEGLINFKRLPALFETFDVSGRTKLMYYAVCAIPAPVCQALKKAARAAGK